ncbi:MAG TPA: zinc-ribbon domain-containing protein [Anaerolineales bacterium]|nr:zinc-ribbon domain-containing protein [Anaerolineales bacterium]
MRCPNCHQEIPDSAKVCGHCGRRLTAAAPAPSKRGLPGWAWGAGGALLVVIVGGALFASGVIALPGSREATSAPPTFVAVAPVATSTLPEPTPTSSPAPTLTPSAPSPSPVTPTDDPLSGSGVVVLEDDFSDPASGWTVSGSENHDARYTDGGYRVILGGEWTWDYQQYLQGNPQGDFDNFILRADLTPQAFVGFGGLVFRRSAPYNFYTLEVNPAGEYRLMRADQAGIETWTTLIDWTSSPALVKGLNTNRLTVVASGDTISLYANGQFLASRQDKTYQSGWIGLHVGRTSQEYQNGSTAEFLFDNVMIADIASP